MLLQDKHLPLMKLTFTSGKQKWSSYYLVLEIGKSTLVKVSEGQYTNIKHVDQEFKDAGRKT